MRILYTSGSPTMRAVLRNMLLRRADLELDSASNPEDAVAAAVALKPDVVVFDEQGNGASVMRLGELLRTHRVSVRIVVLADPMIVDLQRLPQGHDLVPKPFTTEQLLEAVARSMAGA